jgi:hypothetical protein
MKLDLRAIIETPLRQFAPWLASVLIVTWAGYPGVVCVTPMAWLIALRVGNVCVEKSGSEASPTRLTEAALAGGILGLLQGILFAVIVPMMGPLRDDEISRMTVLTAILLVVGVLAGAGLSLFTAFLNEGRRKRGMTHRQEAETG